MRRMIGQRDRVNFSRRDVDRARAACLHVTPAHVDLLVRIFRFDRGAEVKFQSFGCLHADRQPAMASQTIHDRDIDVGTADSFRTRRDDRSADDGGDVRGAAADIHDRRGVFIVDRNSGANRRRLSFLDHVDATDARLFSSGKQRALFNLSHFRKHAHNCAPTEMRCAAACFPDEVVQHRSRSLKIGDDAVNERRQHRDVARFAALHLVSFNADGDHFTGDLVNGNEGRFIDDYATAAHSNDRAC